MKSVPLTLVFLVLLAFTTVMNAQEQSGEQAVRRVVRDSAGAINRGDAKAFAALFAEDADFVVITGKYLKGRNEIVTYHARLFTDNFQGSHLDVTSVAIRFLRTDVAIARMATKRTENGGKEMRTSFPMFVLTKQGESWLIAAVQNTLTSGPRFLQLVLRSAPLGLTFFELPQIYLGASDDDLDQKEPDASSKYPPAKPGALFV